MDDFDSHGQAQFQSRSQHLKAGTEPDSIEIVAGDEQKTNLPVASPPAGGELFARGLAALPPMGYDDYFAVKATPREVVRSRTNVLGGGVVSILIGVVLALFIFGSHFALIGKHDNPFVFFSILMVLALVSYMSRRMQGLSRAEMRARDAQKRKQAAKFVVVVYGLIAVVGLVFFCEFQNINSNISKGDTLRRSGDYIGAISTYRSTFAISAPERAKLETRVGITYKEMHKYDEALASFAKALSIYPSDVTAAVGQADTYSKMGELDKAEKLYSALIEKYPRNPILYRGRARVYERMGKSDLAGLDREKGRMPYSYTK